MSKLFEERNACNFYRSYWETGQLLPENERLEYYDSILKAQFTGDIEEPSGNMALLAFKGQVHSIKKQIIGFERGKQTYPNGNPTKGKGKGKHKEEQGQEKEKEKGKEEEKGQYDFYPQINEDKKYIFDKWLEYRVQIKKPITVKSTLMSLANRFNNEPIVKVEYVVYMSIENNWQGLFWDKFSPTGNGGNTKSGISL